MFDDITKIRPRPPYPLDSRRYAADFNELKTMGSIDSTARTPRQTETALFWMESSPQGWNRIARSVAGGLDGWDAARLFGLLNAAQADGYIANWDSKYLYNRWRPESAIQFEGDDTNPLTEGDPDWRPLRTNGATPEYDSGHSIEGAASAEIMRRILGRDRITFTACSYDGRAGHDTGAEARAEVRRTYHRFSEASVENGESRILLGWHFRNAVEVGRDRGTMIGATTVRELLRPTH